METSKGIIPYPSLSKFDKEDGYLDDLKPDTWEGLESVSSHTSGQVLFKDGSQHQMPVESDIWDEYDCGEDQFTEPASKPEINLKNVLTGIVSIVTGANKISVNSEHQEGSSEDPSFLTSKTNGDICLHSSVCLPSAPPMFQIESINYADYKVVLDSEPPEWLPDSYTTVCMQCNSLFTALTRGRHHCRFCGGVFCRACAKGRCLLPQKFRVRDPQRVCDRCYERLDPLQGILINSVSNAAQTAKHDVLDWTCTRGWLNLPVGLSMEHEIYKASNALRSYCQVCFFNILMFCNYYESWIADSILFHVLTICHTII